MLRAIRFEGLDPHRLNGVLAVTSSLGIWPLPYMGFYLCYQHAFLF